MALCELLWDIGLQTKQPWEMALCKPFDKWLFFFCNPLDKRPCATLLWEMTFCNPLCETGLQTKQAGKQPRAKPLGKCPFATPLDKWL
jgi:hypothetical protein